MDSEQEQSTSGMRAALWVALTRPFGGHTTQHAIREIAVPDPRLFFEVALTILDSLDKSSLRVRACGRLFDCPEFLLELLREGRFSDEELQRRCSEWAQVDRFLDVRLARLVPGRHDDAYGLPPETVARILEVLNHISSGPRLILMLNHLKNHSNPLVAERATVLVGRRLYSRQWVQERLASTDPRIRAAAVEGLWGHDLHAAGDLLRKHQRDENNRVAGNALLGLHFLGEPNVNGLLEDMIRDARPDFRQTAAWVMGQIGAEEFIGLLEAALSDPEPGVQVAADQALATIRLGVSAEQRFAVRKRAKTVAKPIEPAKSEEPSKPKPKPNHPAFRFRFDGSFSTSSDQNPDGADPDGSDGGETGE